MRILFLFTLISLILFCSCEKTDSLEVSYRIKEVFHTNGGFQLKSEYVYEEDNLVEIKQWHILNDGEPYLLYNIVFDYQSEFITETHYKHYSNGPEIIAKYENEITNDRLVRKSYPDSFEYTYGYTPDGKLLEYHCDSRHDHGKFEYKGDKVLLHLSGLSLNEDGSLNIRNTRLFNYTDDKLSTINLTNNDYTKWEYKYSASNISSIKFIGGYPDNVKEIYAFEFTIENGLRTVINYIVENKSIDFEIKYEKGEMNNSCILEDPVKKIYGIPNFRYISDIHNFDFN